MFRIIIAPLMFCCLSPQLIADPYQSQSATVRPELIGGFNQRLLKFVDGVRIFACALYGLVMQASKPINPLYSVQTP